MEEDPLTLEKLYSRLCVLEHQLSGITRTLYDLKEVVEKKNYGSIGEVGTQGVVAS